MSNSDQGLTSVRTRSGKETHLVLNMQPTTLCGRYLRAQASQLKVSAPATCEKCLASAEGMES